MQQMTLFNTCWYFYEFYMLILSVVCCEKKIE